MKKVLFIITAILVVAAVLTYISPKDTVNKPANITTSANPKAVEVLAQNLEIPWAIDFMPSGEIIFTQRSGTLSVLRNGQVKDISKINGVLASGEGGLLGIALHPNFTSNHYLYLYFTFQSSGNNTKNKVVRYIFENDTVKEDEVIVEDIPGAIFHNGGRLKFGPDNFLYITTGDSLNPSLAQNKNSLAGKILRVTDAGASALGNPFNNLVWSMGHRNPQGITWEGDRLFETEHGNSAHDELNVIAKGGNFGWPIIQGNETRSGLISPLAQSGNETWAPAGLSFLDGFFYFSGLRGQALFKVKLDGSNAIITKHFLGQFGRIRDVVVGPDNLLYITTSNRDGRGSVKPNDDKIIKIDPSKL